MKKDYLYPFQPKKMEELVIYGNYGTRASVKRMINHENEYAYILNTEITVDAPSFNSVFKRIIWFLCDRDILSFKELSLKDNNGLALYHEDTRIEIVSFEVFQLFDFCIELEKKLKTAIQDLELYKSTKEFIEQSEKLSRL